MPPSVHTTSSLEVNGSLPNNRLTPAFLVNVRSSTSKPVTGLSNTISIDATELVRGLATGVMLTVGGTVSMSHFSSTLAGALPAASPRPLPSSARVYCPEAAVRPSRPLSVQVRLSLLVSTVPPGNRSAPSSLVKDRSSISNPVTASSKTMVIVATGEFRGSGSTAVISALGASVSMIQSIVSPAARALPALSAMPAATKANVKPYCPWTAVKAARPLSVQDWLSVDVRASAVSRLPLLSSCRSRSAISKPTTGSLKTISSVDTALFRGSLTGVIATVGACVSRRQLSMSPTSSAINAKSSIPEPVATSSSV